MPRLVAFMQVSLDGYFADRDGDFRWAHDASQDADFAAFVAGNAQGGGMLLFGRITYQLMAGYWPTPLASQNDPIVAERMNALPKLVFSRSLDEASWANTRLVKDGLVAEISRLKQASGPDLATLGSGSLVAQLGEAGLVDEFQIVVVPVVLGGGRSLFGGIERRLDLTLIRTRAFGNGNVLLCYRPKLNYGDTISNSPR